VLVVDDQPSMLELLEAALSAEGAAVLPCPTAREALAQLPVWRPDILISDIAMPDEDGYWLIRQLRRLAPEKGGAIPAVALTAYVRMEDRLQLLAAGFQQYVSKPLIVAELRDVILRLLSAGPLGQEPRTKNQEPPLREPL
jgi:CheY-like chemotaxis protein